MTVVGSTPDSAGLDDRRLEDLLERLVASAGAPERSRYSTASLSEPALDETVARARVSGDDRHYRTSYVVTAAARTIFGHRGRRGRSADLG